MESYIEMMILGLLQGITEFLPVSSSGHLALGHHLFGVESVETMMMEAVLHLATLIAIFIVYWRTIQSFAKPENWRMVGFLILAMIPTGIMGLIVQGTHLDETLVEMPLCVGLGFLATAAFLWFGLAPRKNEESSVTMAQMSWKQSLWIGFIQGVALIPGISRSGSTISMAVASGVKRADAAQFSFLLSILAVMAGVGLKFMIASYHVYSGKESMVEAFGASEFGPLLAGFLVAMISGYIALVFLLKLLSSGALRYFAIYCLIAGLITVIFGASLVLNPKTPVPSSPGVDTLKIELPHPQPEIPYSTVTP